MAEAEHELLERVFGSLPSAKTIREYALASQRTFIRSQDQLALDLPGATGRRLTAVEAYDTFGFDKLLDAVENGSAVLPPSLDEPSSTLRRAREGLGLSQQTVATRAGVSLALMRDAENAGKRTPIRILERLSRVLGLDERLIAFSPTASQDAGFGARLKQLGKTNPAFTDSLVATLAESAWVVRTETRLRQLLGLTPKLPANFDRDNFYGTGAFRAWEHGYLLAERTRALLGISRNETIRPLRTLLFELGIPLVQAQMPKHVAGATIATGGVRGIIVNTRGANANAWVRRSTIAHELGHLLWDPDSRLRSVNVDDYSTIGKYSSAFDFVEARANAFAVEFLAPRREVDLEYRIAPTPEDGLRRVMERFGVSFTAARYHVKNASEGSHAISSIVTPDHNPTDDWQATEAYTDDWFPLPRTSALRRGIFAACVVAAADRGIVHEDTASMYLDATVEEYRAARTSIAEAFADVVPVLPD